MRFEDLLKFKGREPKISASLISSYYNCPRAFKLIEVDGFIAKEGPALALGNMWDEMFKAFHRGEDPYNKIKTELDKFGRKKYYDDTPTALQLEHLGQCRIWMEEYKKHPLSLNNPKFDVGFGIPLVHPHSGEQLKYLVSGYMDGLDDRGRRKFKGIEVKTTTKPYIQNQVDNAIQATIYIYYMFVEHKEMFPLEYVVFNKKVKTATKDKKIIERFTTTRNPVDFIDLFETLKQFIEDVEADKFDANPDHPFWCSCRPGKLA